jgi:hypothetical protein
MVRAVTPFPFRRQPAWWLAPRLPNGENGGAGPGRARPLPNGENGGARGAGATPPADGGVVLHLAWEVQGAGPFAGRLRGCARAQGMLFRIGAPTDSGPLDVARTPGGKPTRLPPEQAGGDTSRCGGGTGQDGAAICSRGTDGAVGQVRLAGGVRARPGNEDHRPGRSATGYLGLSPR